MTPREAAAVQSSATGLLSSKNLPGTFPPRAAFDQGKVSIRP
jgi:hypothetical protein